VLRRWLRDEGTYFEFANKNDTGDGLRHTLVWLVTERDVLHKLLALVNIALWKGHVCLQFEVV
jgi:hypothetical protein